MAHKLNFQLAFEDKAVKSAEILLKPNLIHNWKKNLPNLLEATDISGRCPIHIAARRGFHGILGLIPKCYLLFEANTGFTPLHAAASLGETLLKFQNLASRTFYSVTLFSYPEFFHFSVHRGRGAG